jgi:hypothetical protein
MWMCCTTLFVSGRMESDEVGVDPPPSIGAHLTLSKGLGVGGGEGIACWAQHPIPSSTCFTFVRQTHENAAGNIGQGV